MTKREAKKLTIEVWTYFVEHPECTRKVYLPKKLFNKIIGLRAWCPLCEYHYQKSNSEEYGCVKCCIAMHHDCSLYWKWHDACSDKERTKAARAIVDKVKAW